MKPFRAFLAEQDQDYEYKLYSVENIHNAEMMAKIRLALGNHGLIDIEKQGVMTKMNDSSNMTFDEYPFSPVYVSKVTLSSPLSSRAAVQSVSLFTRIKDDKLAFLDKSDEIVMDGADAEQHSHPVEVDSKDAQEEVGDARAQTLVSDLMKDIIAGREANTIELEVYEGFVTSHREIKEASGESVRAGFYVFEDTKDGPIMTGPLKKLPENYSYKFGLRNLQIKRPLTTEGDLMEYAVSYEEDQQADPADAGRRIRSKSYEAEVIDQDSGRSYNVMVRAHSSFDARQQAVDKIAAKHGLRKEALIPVKPEAEAAN